MNNTLRENIRFIFSKNNFTLKYSSVSLKFDYNNQKKCLNYHKMYDFILYVYQRK